jgi:hypothetical protein
MRLEADSLLAFGANLSAPGERIRLFSSLTQILRLNRKSPILFLLAIKELIYCFSHEILD